MAYDEDPKCMTSPDPKYANRAPRDGTLLCCKVNGRRLNVSGCNCLFKMCSTCIIYNFDIPSKIWKPSVNANADVHYKFNPTCHSNKQIGAERIDGNKTI